MREEEISRTKTEWAQDWQKKGKSTWTRKIVPNLRPWIERKHGEIDRLLTQALSGHGVFNTYLHATGKAKNDICLYCEHVDTPEHALFECTNFTEVREKTEGNDGKMTAENVMRRMTKSKSGWDKYAEMLTEIGKGKGKRQKPL